MESTEDAPDLTDSDADRVPDWVETVASEFEHAWDVEVEEFDFRPPKSDASAANPGPNQKLDVYLADIGAGNEYGFCTSDDPNDPRVNSSSQYTYGDYFTYCVIDNDYSVDQFGTDVFGLAALRVTAAHELFHAIHCAYDCNEDRWFAEGTAVLMEEFVHDEVNNSHTYLDKSPLGQPGVSADNGSGEHGYGAWIFWDWFSEVAGPASGPDPSVLRRLWELTDASSSGPNMYSLQATEAVAAEAGLSFTNLFRRFGMANRFPGSYYQNGESLPRSPLAARHSLRPGAPAAGPVGMRLDHLTTRYVGFTPGRGTPPDARLRVRVIAPRREFARATLVAQKSSGSLSTKLIRLGPDGEGARVVRFGRGRISSLTLVLTNASSDFDCAYERGRPYACGGFPLYDGQAYTYRAKLLR